MQKKTQIKAFIAKWLGKGKEKQDTHKFWEELVELVLEVEHGRDILDFEKDAPVSVVPVEDGENVKWIDCYVKPSRCVIEQKSHGIPLNKKTASYIDDKDEKHEINAIQQAKLYYNRLNQSDQGRYFIACNFNEFVVVDNERKQNEPVRFELKDLQRNIRFLFRVLAGNQNKEEQDDLQDATAKTASGFVKKLYDLLKSQYKSSEITNDILHQLNVFCVRVVFCLYADDDELFEDGQFHTFLETFSAKKLEEKFRWLFRAINCEPLKRDLSLDKEIMAFPRVNGGLFRDDVAIPRLSEEIKEFILHGSDNLVMPGKDGNSFHWSQISPTNFGCIFESTLDPETRKENGMHYTTPKSIHKVIDPLFLNKLNEKFESLCEMPKETKAEQKTRNEALSDFRTEIASLKFLDPACGSGNFLTETFKSLRRLEMKIIKELPNYGLVGTELRTESGALLLSPCKVSINQFYGIEINDFASQVALCALWISECQMTTEAEELFNDTINRLPLKHNSNIECANALEKDWKEIIAPKKLNYIIGNPPFKGARGGNDSKEEKERKKAEMNAVMSDKNDKGKNVWDSIGNLDYVCAWYAKSAQYIKENSAIKVALVSTNSIVQGEQAILLWKPLFEHYKLKIMFAHKTFKWESESSDKAQVHCVIVGFGNKRRVGNNCKIYEEGKDVVECEQINNYLMPADTYFLNPGLTKPLCNVAKIGIGNKPIDNGNYLFSSEEKDQFIQLEPMSSEYFHSWYGAKEFITGKPRYCLWLGECEPNKLVQMPMCLKRVEAVRKYRLESDSPGTQKLADKPTRFHVENMPGTDCLIIPEVSTQRRTYVPIGYLDRNSLGSDKVRLMRDATEYHLGILESSVHMAWMRIVCGRMKSDYSYSISIVYNNFPWPSNVDESMKDNIANKARSILSARANHPDCNLEQLYDPLTMPSDLVDAHHANDKAVFAAYAYLGISSEMSDEEIALILLRESIRLANLSKKKPMCKKKTKKVNKKQTRIAFDKAVVHS